MLPVLSLTGIEIGPSYEKDLFFEKSRENLRGLCPATENMTIING